MGTNAKLRIRPNLICQTNREMKLLADVCANNKYVPAAERDMCVDRAIPHMQSGCAAREICKSNQTL